MTLLIYGGPAFQMFEDTANTDFTSVLIKFNGIE